MTTGIVSSWGDNALGQLGNGGTAGRSAPGEVKDLDGVAAIAAGSGNALAVRDDGTVWGWGRNSFGQVGNGTMSDQSLPVQVLGLTGVVKVSAAGGHSIALRDDGTVWAWGAGFFGALGPATFRLQPTPVQVTDLTDVTNIYAGGAHNLAVREDGTLWTWGRDDHGQLGDADPDGPGRLTLQYEGVDKMVRPHPAQVDGLRGVIGVGAGGGHSFAILSDGTLMAWGFNDCGQLGDGTLASRPVPRPVAGLPGPARAVAGGYHHTVVALADGTVWAWGLNDGGQAGPGGGRNQLTPVHIEGLTEVVAVAANGGGTHEQPGGGGHCLALRADGSVWAWGHNDVGQLGDGTTAGRRRPVEVHDLHGASAVAAGGEIPPTNTFGAAPVGGFGMALRHAHELRSGQ